MPSKTDKSHERVLPECNERFKAICRSLDELKTWQKDTRVEVRDGFSNLDERLRNHEQMDIDQAIDQARINGRLTLIVAFVVAAVSAAIGATINALM